MANESKKDFNKMLNDSKDMPKIQVLKDEKMIKKYGEKMFFAPPLFYDELMRKVPFGKLLIMCEMRDFLAKKNGADFTDPMTAGIFVSIVAWAAYQREQENEQNITPWWRILKKDGELNAKYPQGVNLQKSLLENEGHIIICKGKKNLKYYVKNFEKSLIKLD